MPFTRESETHTASSICTSWSSPWAWGRGSQEEEDDAASSSPSLALFTGSVTLSAVSATVIQPLHCCTRPRCQFHCTRDHLCPRTAQNWNGWMLMLSTVYHYLNVSEQTLHTSILLLISKLLSDQTTWKHVLKNREETTAKGIMFGEVFRKKCPAPAYQKQFLH